MTPLNRVYLKVFLVMFILFAASSALLELAFMEETFNWLSVVVQGLFTALLFTLLGRWLHGFTLKRESVNIDSEQQLGVIQNAEARGTLSTEELIGRLRAHHYFGGMKLKKSGDRIVLSAPMTWMSWGERITIDILQIDNDEFQYSIESKPTLATTLIDYGKNFKNIQELKYVLQSV